MFDMKEVMLAFGALTIFAFVFWWMSVV